MDNSSIKKNVANLRTSRGITQEEMADRMGICLSSYRDFERETQQ